MVIINEAFKNYKFIAIIAVQSLNKYEFEKLIHSGLSALRSSKVVTSEMDLSRLHL